MAKMDESDAWDQGNGQFRSTFMGQTTSLKQAAKARIVRDAWDEEEEEEQEGDTDKAKELRQDGTTHTNGPLSEREAEEDSSKIWEEANKGAPMPELIVASASTSQSVSPPPPAAFQPALRILKRPSANVGGNSGGAASPSAGLGSGTSSSPNSGVTSPTPRGTLAEREAQYQEARSRIFGDGRATPGGVVIVRDPLGPTSEPEMAPCSDRPAKGFGERRKGKKQ